MCIYALSLLLYCAGGYYNNFCDDGDDKKTPVGTIVGSVIGSIVGLISCCAVACCIGVCCYKVL